MDKKKLQEYTKKRTKLIGSLMSSMQEQVVENQRKVYERMLLNFGKLKIRRGLIMILKMI